MMMFVMQNTVVVFLKMVRFLDVFVMIFLRFWFLFYNGCHDVRDFKVYKIGAILVLFWFVFFIIVGENFLRAKMKK